MNTKYCGSLLYTKIDKKGNKVKVLCSKDHVCVNCPISETDNFDDCSYCGNVKYLGINYSTWKVILVVLFALAVLISTALLSSASPLDDFNISEEMKEGVCTALNVSIFKCVSMWFALDNLGNSSTINLSKYMLISELPETNDSNVSEEDILSDLEKIDNYAQRGYCPIFDKGVVSDWLPCQNQTGIEQNDSVPVELDFEELLKIEVAKNSVIPVEVDDSGDFKFMVSAILIGLLGLGGLYLYDKSRKAKVPRVDGHVETYEHPLPVPVMPPIPMPSGEMVGLIEKEPPFINPNDSKGETDGFGS